MNQLDQLREFSTVVADTGDFQVMRQYQPEDATTNPSLIFNAARQEAYAPLVNQAVAETKGIGLSGSALINASSDRILVLFGKAILDIIPGRVSTEIDARLSFDQDATVVKARRIIELYEREGINRERVLIKIASTWEGIAAAGRLEDEGIRCNLTLLFSLVQAATAAEAGVTLISPFVGRIYDWHKKTYGRDYAAAEDPGVQSIRDIYAYYKKLGYPTEIMGASFRNTGQILELAGCDLLTISPQLLEQLRNSEAEVAPKLTGQVAKSSNQKEISVDEKSFRFLLNEDAMATEKTAEGIRNFSADMVKLEDLVRAAMS